MKDSERQSLLNHEKYRALPPEKKGVFDCFLEGNSTFDNLVYILHSISATSISKLVIEAFFSLPKEGRTWEALLILFNLRAEKVYAFSRLIPENCTLVNLKIVRGVDLTARQADAFVNLPVDGHTLVNLLSVAKLTKEQALTLMLLTRTDFNTKIENVQAIIEYISKSCLEHHIAFKNIYKFNRNWSALEVILKLTKEQAGAFSSLILEEERTLANLLSVANKLTKEQAVAFSSLILEDRRFSILMISNKIELTDEQKKEINFSKELSSACMRGRLEIVRMLLQIPGIDVNAQDSHGEIPINYAIEWNKQGQAIEIEKMLLEAEGMNINAKGQKGNTALITAHGKKEILEMLLKITGIDVNARNNNGETALHWATGEDPELVKILLKITGIDVNAQDSHGNTPLHILVNKGSLEKVRMLLQIPGIDVNAQDSHGNTPLHIGITKIFESSKAILEILLQIPGIDVNARNNNGETALHWAASDCISKEVWGVLMNSGIKPNIKNKNGHTLLQLVLYDKTKLEMLLQITGIDVNARNNDGETALPNVNLQQQTAAVGSFGALTNVAIDVNARNNDGETALPNVNLQQQTAAVGSFGALTNVAMVNNLIRSRMVSFLKESNSSYVHWSAQGIYMASPVISYAVVDISIAYSLEYPLATTVVYVSRYGLPGIWDVVGIAAITAVPMITVGFLSFTPLLNNLVYISFAIKAASVFSLLSHHSEYDKSKSAEEILNDLVKHNSDPSSVGVLTYVFATTVYGIGSTAALPMALGAGLLTDYAWTAYERETLITLPSSVEEVGRVAKDVFSRVLDLSSTINKGMFVEYPGQLNIDIPDIAII